MGERYWIGWVSNAMVVTASVYTKAANLCRLGTAMSNNSLELGNYLIILLGAGLIFLGPYILYKSVTDILRRRREGKPLSFFQWASHGLNLVIAVAFVYAGFHFVVNNLQARALI